MILLRPRLVLLFTFVYFVYASKKPDCRELARGEETYIVFSTLGGGLTAVHPLSGEIRWNIDDEPAVKTETNQNCPLPHYLPDPRDGSIYQLGNQGDLKKLPFTIPELVANAPCRSSDGILYSGKKSDMWFLVDPKSGAREKVMGFGQVNDKMKSQGTGALWTDSRSIYLGRTQYTVMMYDSLSTNKDAKPWNITFYDYASHTMAPEISSEYEYLHLTGNPSGKVVTLERKGGKFQWEVNLTSPIVAAFLLGPEGLLSIPFTTISDDALNQLLEEKENSGIVSNMKLYNYLYVGEHSKSLYALPSLSGKKTPTITSRSSNLIDGPDTLGNGIPMVKFPSNFEEDGIFLGHYELPQDFVHIDISPRQHVDNKQLSTQIQYLWGGSVDADDKIPLTLSADSAMNNSTFLNKTRLRKFINDTKVWFIDHPSSGTNQLLVLVLIIFFVMFWYIMSTVRELKSQSSSQNRIRSFGTSTSDNFSNLQDPIDLGKGEVRVGKIQFNCQQVLGKGCEGTFVFRGTFEERKVAVKRLLPECFTFADREVSLLRESDAHENVVRYFCTEQDKQFRYIAVELCAATLQDYTEGDSAVNLRKQISVWNVLTQATSGLSHLHSLNIVHRDIKPQNVLLSFPNVKGGLKVMISDFGLCKKLNYGKASFSRRSGITGTEGWIAPEMIRGQRTTTSVDIFSLGCVFYYVLSKGKHPFGDTLKRQANILANDADLEEILEIDDDLESKMILSQQLVSDMIHKDPQRRPPAKAIKAHPAFWEENRMMSFLQDVSDRVEKLTFENEPLRTLEKNGRFVVRDDWNLHVDKVISEDIRKYRGYMGASVRDLLRAFRNKKHHYHELTEEAQEVLGHIPEEFTLYWVRKFPQLISHTFHAMSICSHENSFKSYYNKNYHFTMPNYFEDGSGDQWQLFDDPRHLQKQSKAGWKSPVKKSNRRGAYNFRKDPNQNQQPPTTGSPNNASGSDVFANFRFRNRNGAPKQRFAPAKNAAPQGEIPWLLHSDDSKNDKAD